MESLAQCRRVFIQLRLFALELSSSLLRKILPQLSHLQLLDLHPLLYLPCAALLQLAGHFAGSLMGTGYVDLVLLLLIFANPA